MNVQQAVTHLTRIGIVTTDTSFYSILSHTSCCLGIPGKEYSAVTLGVALQSPDPTWHLDTSFFGITVIMLKNTSFIPKAHPVADKPLLILGNLVPEWTTWVLNVPFCIDFPLFSTDLKSALRGIFLRYMERFFKKEHKITVFCVFEIFQISEKVVFSQIYFFVKKY